MLPTCPPPSQPLATVPAALLQPLKSQKTFQITLAPCKDVLPGPTTVCSQDPRYSRATWTWLGQPAGLRAWSWTGSVAALSPEISALSGANGLAGRLQVGKLLLALLPRAAANRANTPGAATGQPQLKYLLRRPWCVSGETLLLLGHFSQQQGWEGFMEN